MQFFLDNDVYKVIRIIGPSHNLLGLSFHDGGDEERIVIQPVASAKDESERIAAADVLEHVLNGIRAANEQFGTAFRVKTIQFLPGDSPPSSVYQGLAMTIVERLHQRGSFKQLH